MNSALLTDEVIHAAHSGELDEKAKAPVVQQKGRFKVTSENHDSEKVGFIMLGLVFSSCELCG